MIGYVWSARIAKSGRVVRELIAVAESDVPPGASFVRRHEAKQYGDQGDNAPRIELER